MIFAIRAWCGEDILAWIWWWPLGMNIVLIRRILRRVGSALTMTSRSHILTSKNAKILHYEVCSILPCLIVVVQDSLRWNLWTPVTSLTLTKSELDIRSPPLLSTTNFAINSPNFTRTLKLPKSIISTAILWLQLSETQLDTEID